MNGLETRLLAAHAAGDKSALVTLYEEAAAGAETPEAQGFFLTQAYVYALEIGHAKASTLHQRLKASGREA
ncbi:hypothetical protein [Shimia sagamensis]|uniref:Uncharacterized protein n=1 Tax=Shimia sagamensis TaxID=1566352 RepID=A0ABY1P032_9RHOB|nr:hypothetical protein [Shimia sagamensis]SMP22697.1 hypothetical protein SAMN06265373_104250 [Shimia sagamensis]